MLITRKMNLWYAMNSVFCLKMPDKRFLLKLSTIIRFNPLIPVTHKPGTYSSMR